jgi:spermidine/putrescine transport system substrate-binding protein
MNEKQKTLPLWSLRLATQALIVIIYLSILAVFLYSPHILKMLYSSDNTLNIYAFTEMISPEAIAEFEKEHGVSISIKYFETNEDLYTKFKISGGEGYDIVTPSDYMVELLRKDGLLKKLEHQKLPCMTHLDHRLMRNYYDENNDYSLPLAWVPYGIVFRKDLFKVPMKEMSLDIIFKNPEMWFQAGMISKKFRICMVDDAREAVMLSLIYLFGDTRELGPDRIAQIQNLLIKQKDWVESYLSSSLEYFLLGGIAPVALASSLFVRNTIENDERFAFMIPKEGSMLVIENLAVPAACKKEALVYKFINFLLSRRISALNSNLYGYNPTNRLAYADVEEKVLSNPNYFPPDKIFKKLHLLHNKFSLKVVEAIWLGVKFG